MLNKHSLNEGEATEFPILASRWCCSISWVSARALESFLNWNTRTGVILVWQKQQCLFGPFLGISCVMCDMFSICPWWNPSSSIGMWRGFSAKCWGQLHILGSLIDNSADKALCLPGNVCIIIFLNYYILLEEIDNEKGLTIHWHSTLNANLIYTVATVKFCLFPKSVP